MLLQSLASVVFAGMLSAPSAAAPRRFEWPLSAGRAPSRGAVIAGVDCSAGGINIVVEYCLVDDDRMAVLIRKPAGHLSLCLLRHSDRSLRELLEWPSRSVQESHVASFVERDAPRVVTVLVVRTENLAGGIFEQTRTMLDVVSLAEAAPSNIVTTSLQIGAADVVHRLAADGPYKYRAEAVDDSPRPGRRVTARIFVGDVNGDARSDLLVWKRTLVSPPRGAASDAFLLAGQEWLGLVASDRGFRDPVPMAEPTSLLDVLWESGFPTLVAGPGSPRREP